jgi:hypothetical protein
MKFYRVISDVNWKAANHCSASAESSPDRERVTPPIACPVCGNQTRDTRNHGYFYPAASIERFPRELRRKLDYGRVLDPDQWEALRKEVVSYLPYEVPISPCALFGRERIRFTNCLDGPTRFRTTWLKNAPVSRAERIGESSFNSIRRRTPACPGVTVAESTSGFVSATWLPNDSIVAGLWFSAINFNITDASYG